MIINNAIEMSDGTVLKYLRDINIKLMILLERVEKLETRFETLGSSVREAFEQVREIVGVLALEQRGVRVDLAEARGVIEAETWFS